MELYRVTVEYIAEGGEHREYEYGVYDDPDKAIDIIEKIKKYPCIRIQEYKGKWTYSIYGVYMQTMRATNKPFNSKKFAKQKSWHYE